MKTEIKKSDFTGFHIVSGILLYSLILTLSLQEIGLVEINFVDKISQWKFPWQKHDEALVVGGKQKIYTPEEFVLHAGKVSDSRRIKQVTKIYFEEGESVIGTKAKFALIEPFKEDWEFTEFDPVLKEFELSATDEFGLGISHYANNYFYFVENYGPGNKFKVDPRPKYIVYFGGKTYLISQSGKLWKRRYR